MNPDGSDMTNILDIDRSGAFRAHNQSPIIQVKTKKQQIKLLLFSFEIPSWRSRATISNNRSSDKSINKTALLLL